MATTLPYVGRAPDSDAVLVPKSYADTTNAAQALTTAQVNAQIAATTPSLTTASYVDSRDVLRAHKSDVSAADGAYVSTTLLNVANGVAGLDSVGNVISTLLPAPGSIATDRILTCYSMPLPTINPLFEVRGTNGLLWNTSATSATFTGAHNSVGGLNTVVLAYVNADTNIATEPSFTVNYGSTAMTLWKTFNYHITSGSPGNYTDVAVFYLFNPPAGSQTVTYGVTAATGANLFATGQTVSYTNVGSLGTAVTNSDAVGSTTASLANVPCGTNALVSMVFANSAGGGSFTFSAFNKTSRYNQTTASVGTYMMIGEAGGAATESFTASIGTSIPWGAIGVPLIGPAVPTANATGVMDFSGSVTVTSSSSPTKLAHIPVADPGWPWRPVPIAWVMGDSSGSTVPATRALGTGSYGLLTVTAPGPGQVYGAGIATGSYYSDLYPVIPYAVAGQTPTSVPPVTGALELDLYAQLWSGTTYTFYAANIVFMVYVVPAI